jgi:hypothetical protein
LPWRPDIEFDVVADVMMEFHPAGRLTTVRRLTPEVVKRATFGSKVTPADTSVVSRDWDSSQPWEISGALEELYRYCTALGADGFIQLRVTHRTHELGSKSHRDLVFSGYAIQRKR